MFFIVNWCIFRYFWPFNKHLVRYQNNMFRALGLLSDHAESRLLKNCQKHPRLASWKKHFKALNRVRNGFPFPKYFQILQKRYKYKIKGGMWTQCASVPWRTFEITNHEASTSSLQRSMAYVIGNRLRKMI